jgi:hypothetical protein
LDAEDLPKQVSDLASELIKYKKALNEFLEFNDEQLNAGIDICVIDLKASN